MTKDSNISEELPIRQRIVNCFNGDDQVPVRAIDNLEALIEAHVAQAVKQALKDVEDRQRIQVEPSNRSLT